MSRTCNLLVTSPILYQLDHCTHTGLAPTVVIIIIIIITTTMCMVLSSWQSHCESSPGPFDECRTAPSGRRPKTKPDDLGFESACTGCQSLHPPSLFIIITKPERGYSFQGGWKAESTKLAGYIPRWFTRPQTRHPSWY